MPLNVGPALDAVLTEPSRRPAFVTAGVLLPLLARHVLADDRLPVYLVPASRRDGEAEPVDQRRREEPHELAGQLTSAVGTEPRVLPASGSVSAALTRAELLEAITAVNAAGVVELDPLVNVALLDTALPSIALATGGPPLRSAAGVRVAVLDSGIDDSHPALRVVDQVSTFPGEPVTVPGDHGTHVAGCVASTDAQFRGVAPDADLINIKVASSANLSNLPAFSSGISEALDRDPHVLVISLGWSHIPSAGLPGHTCPLVMSDGSTTACPFCRAAETAVADNRIVVIAVGNDHARAEGLRAGGMGLSYDTELCCPAQATGAIRVGAVSDAASPAAFSSNAPGSRPAVGITLVAPGVDVQSTVTMTASAGPNGSFATMGGTSQAAPIVAGAMAILTADALRAGETFHADVITQRLLRDHVTPLAGPENVVGAGRLSLAGLT